MKERLIYTDDFGNKSWYIKGERRKYINIFVLEDMESGQEFCVVEHQDKRFPTIAAAKRDIDENWRKYYYQNHLRYEQEKLQPKKENKHSDDLWNEFCAIFN